LYALKIEELPFFGEVCTKVTKELAVADQDLWIWHAFFSMAGSHDDINAL
jgi:hypothetical protein